MEYIEISRFLINFRFEYMQIVKVSFNFYINSLTRLVYCINLLYLSFYRNKFNFCSKFNCEEIIYNTLCIFRLFFYLFSLILYVPVNNFSVMSGLTHRRGGSNQQHCDPKANAFLTKFGVLQRHIFPSTLEDYPKIMTSNNCP